MTFILGTSRLTYDHFGTYDNLQSLAAEQTPAGIIGHVSVPGELVPGCTMLCEDPETVQLDVQVL